MVIQNPIFITSLLLLYMLLFLLFVDYFEFFFKEKIEK